MIGWMAILPWLAGLAAPSDLPSVSRLVVEDQIIFRVPITPRVRRPVRWLETKGLKCLPAKAIAGAVLSGRDSLDFILHSRRRVRATMDSDCPALDFYGGFYTQPEDDRLCAKRDVIRSRVGGECRIQKLRVLVPVVGGPSLTAAGPKR